MCTEFKDIANDGRSIFHIASNEESAQNDGHINLNYWYRFVEQGTKKPMKVCCFLTKAKVI